MERKVGTTPEQLQDRLEALEREIASVRAREQRYRTLVESAEDYIFAVDRAGTVLYVNSFAASRYGIPASRCVGQSLARLFPADVAERQLANIRRALELGQPINVEAPSMIGQREVWLHTRLTPVADADGVHRSVVGISRDVTERKAALDALRESEERHRSLFNSTFEGIFILEDGLIRDANQAAAGMTGRAREDLLGQPIAAVMVPECRDLVQSRCGQGGFTPFEAVLARRDGQQACVEVAISPCIYQGRPMHLTAMRDVTERQRLQEEQRRSEKLESLGTLAGGIAHDFNNILMALLGNLVVAENVVEGGHPIRACLRDARQAVQRASDLTRQLLTFSRGGAPVRRQVPVGERLVEWVTFALRGTHVRCDFALAPDLWAAEVDEGQLSQVVHNLVINAVQAMSSGGRIEVRAANEQLADGATVPLPAGRFVRFSIRDEGEGIRPEHLPRVFDPYFTTKPCGTGLGLATSYSIVSSHGGHLGVQSRPGEGATFEVWLPASPSPPPEDPARQAGRGPGGGRVLVMDDDPSVRRVLEQMLAILGYEVVAVADGAAAVSCCRTARARDEAFRAVILDLTVPGAMGGREAAARIREEAPGTCLLASSGYSNDPVLAQPRCFGFAGVLVKPYTLEDLTAVLVAALAAPSA